MSAATRINALRRQAAARRARQEHERLDELTGVQLLRNLARLETVYRQVIDGLDADDRLCGGVDALVTAGDVDGAWALLKNEVRQ